MTTGLWRKRAVPHKGWEHCGVHDLGADESDFQTCEMCELQTIRYVHTVTHPRCSWIGPLEVGVECAGAMTGNRKHASEAQKKVAAMSARRKGFPDLLWKRSRKGGAYMRTRDGFTVTVTPKENGWHAAARRSPRNLYIGTAFFCTDNPKWLSHRGLLPNKQAAQLAAFDLVAKLKASTQ